jgi:uncharacterized damage-inducible protein DinB
MMTDTATNPFGLSKEAAARYTQLLLDALGNRDPLDVLSEQPAQLERATAGLSLAKLRQPEKPGKWSVNQVVQHLADSEIVTGYRIRMILAGDNPEIQAYDQDAWAERLGYAERALADALTQIKVVRSRTIELLRGLTPAEWERAGVHSERGRESVRHTVNLQAGHDIVHLRQIARIKAAIGVT